MGDNADMRAISRRFGVSVVELAGVCTVIGVVAASQWDSATDLFNSAVALNEVNNSVMAEKNAETSKFGYTNVYSASTVEIPDTSEANTSASLNELQAVQADPPLEAQISAPTMNDTSGQ